MEYRRLGRTDLKVSAIGLGTMTWGIQNSEAEGHAQMDLALDRGITFWDTAEMYPVPPGAKTHGGTETIIGSWFQKRGGRDRIVLASKIMGAARAGFEWVRDGRNRLDAPNITRAVEDSLRRLQTDYLDLYQVHWPDRQTGLFGAAAASNRASAADGVPLPETLGVFQLLIEQGKIRHVGLSNETPWGVMTCLKAAEMAGLPRIASLQNIYNLLSRAFEEGLAEICRREEVGLLAYSPMGAGTLSGKYLNGARPAGSRRAIDARKSRYSAARTDHATEAYVAIARRHGLEPAQMALAWVHRRPCVASTLIGATSMAQLRQNIDAFDLTLPAELLAEIDAVHRDNPTPAP
jgi:aryl-alcohol dehydrogenase-like predicted oxidoreductase